MNLDRILEIARQYPERVDILPVLANLASLRRASEPRHPDGLISLNVPDEWVVNLKGESERRDLMFVVRLPRDLADLGKTRLVLPSEAGVPAPVKKRAPKRRPKA